MVDPISDLRRGWGVTWHKVSDREPPKDGRWVVFWMRGSVWTLGWDGVMSGSWVTSAGLPMALEPSASWTPAPGQEPEGEPEGEAVEAERDEALARTVELNAEVKRWKDVMRKAIFRAEQAEARVAELEAECCAIVQERSDANMRAEKAEAERDAALALRAYVDHKAGCAGGHHVGNDPRNPRHQCVCGLRDVLDALAKPKEADRG